MIVEFTARGDREAFRRERWWRENRPAAPGLFEEELLRALDQIRAAPASGKLYGGANGRQYRRVLMPKTQHHVYYRMIAPDRAAVSSVWSARRSRGPGL